MECAASSYSMLSQNGVPRMEIKTERADSESAPSTIRATEIPRSGLVQTPLCPIPDYASSEHPAPVFRGSWPRPCRIVYVFWDPGLVLKEKVLPAARPIKSHSSAFRPNASLLISLK